MTNNNKVLTVSYGTFSCTLEGFEDSFGTMKAIAEYFRDLSTEDRYFGAEPAQPDADMLARIAEREVSRRVEARERDGRIMLTAHDETITDVASDLDAPEPEKVSQPGLTGDGIPPMHPPTSAENMDDPSSDAQVTGETPASKSDAIYPDPVAGDLDMPEQIETDLDNETADIEQSMVVDGPEDDATDPAQPDGPHLKKKVVAQENEQEDAARRAEAFFANSPTFQDTEDEDDAAVQTPSLVEKIRTRPIFDASESDHEAAPIDIAVKLQRIRDVVSQHDTKPPDENDTGVTDGNLSIDGDIGLPPPELETQTTENDDAVDLPGQNEATPDALDGADQIVNGSDESDFEDELSNILNRLEAGDTSGITPDEDATTDESDGQASPEDAPENLFDQDDIDDLQPLPASEALSQETFDSIKTADENPVLGRVMKVDRAAFEAALQNGELEEVDDEETQTLTDDDEEELQRELDAVLAETQDEGDKQPLRASQRPRDTTTSEDVSRLMTEVDQHMEEPDGATRRNAFSHLRAAVAARFADATMQTEHAEEDATQAYRKDLAEAVKPRRPIPSGNRTERPTETQPAPLKLVAEQRVESDGGIDVPPVTPRRIAATVEDTLEDSDDNGFAEYAAHMGATQLPEIVEAAAAYLSLVAGYEEFSRPQLMSRVRQVNCDEFSREDGLRAFGQLLRAGKIEKIKGGRYSASETIGFQPDARAMG